MHTRLIRSLAAAAALALATIAAPAMAQDSGGASYAGESVDPVSGYRCVTPFCDTVVLPGTSCLCQKLNPNETRRQDVRYACTDTATRRQCSVAPN